MKFNYLIRLFRFVLILVFIISTSGFAAPDPQSTRTTQVDLSEPHQSLFSAPVERLGDGFTNIVSGPFELIYQMKEEIKRTTPVRAIIPGLLRGITWFGLREGIGVFEIVTFFLPLDPHLEPFNTDWLHL